MAVTGTGTQADPFVVHSYSEFISLSGHVGVADSSVHIKWFDEPKQVLDCNDYGSEFKWGPFTTNINYASVTYYIDLNGCTIKNFLIADGVTMFEGDYSAMTGAVGKIVICDKTSKRVDNEEEETEKKTGSLRNVFMGSATSKICGDYVEFHDVSISANVAGSTVIPFDGDGNLVIDNSAIYLQAGTLNTSLFNNAIITDTDLELHIGDQNQKNIFASTNLTDCRIQGKISGYGLSTGYNADTCVLDHCGLDGKSLNYTNCVIDLDLTDSRIISYGYGGSRYDVFLNYNGYNFNTNVICNSHHPNDTGHESSYDYQSDWNFMSHSLMRNGAYLNNQGFTVVEVVEG